MDGILILFHCRRHRAGIVPRITRVLGRAIRLDVGMYKLPAKAGSRGMSRAHVALDAALPQSDRNAVTLYPGYHHPAMNVLRSVVAQGLPGASERTILVLPFVSRRTQALTSPTDSGSPAGLDPTTWAAQYQLRELLSAALANSHACENWLRGPTPNLPRARLSVANVTRDLHLAAQMV
jgi:hypothetical protein